MRIFLNDYYGQNKLTPKTILSTPTLLLAFGFGAGLIKTAPGTFGTIAAIPVYLLFVQTPFAIYSALTIMVTLLGIKICEEASILLGEDDFKGIVWDEIAGYLVALWFVPFSWTAVGLGFLLFRFFDIVKPFPIKWVDQHVKGGLGVMLDDVLAGLFAGFILNIVMSL